MTNKEAIKRRYTFGNDEFNLEAAYHDCKLVFDGITDDDSFQEADTGLILYYANEIIYALHEALEGKDIDVPSIDTISRQAAIDMLKNRWKKTRNYEGIGDDIAEECELYLKQVPSAQPEIIRCKDCKYRDENWRRVSVRWLPCMDVRTGSNWYCGSAERGEQDE